jgi:phage baseplate assembly protein V
MLAQAIDRALRPLRQRIVSLVAQGVVRQLREGAVQLAQVELLEGEIRDSVHRLQQYGFNSVPSAGAYPVLVVCPMGDRTQAIALAVDDLRARPQDWAPGDSGLYDERGNSVRLKNGELELTAAGELRISVSGDVQIELAGGNVTIEGAAIANLDAAAINLAGGGPAVARIGDSVVGGVITSGSSKVFSG